MPPSPRIPKTPPSLKEEQSLGYPELWVAGVDEVGRGCLAGPVFAAAAIVPPPPFPSWVSEIHDSKLLKPAQRQRLLPLILKWVTACCVASSSVKEIEELNILKASHLAMQRAVAGLSVVPHAVLVDGRDCPSFQVSRVRAVIGGDRLCLSIATASVIAKEFRDAHLVELDRQYPGYGLAVHKGYATLRHRLALKQRGSTQVHRLSFLKGLQGS